MGAWRSAPEGARIVRPAEASEASEAAQSPKTPINSTAVSRTLTQNVTLVAGSSTSFPRVQLERGDEIYEAFLLVRS
jgi:hypothetical protein